MSLRFLKVALNGKRRERMRRWLVSKGRQKQHQLKNTPLIVEETK